ncbi:MAG: DNA alkylation repair protein, partial [Lachnospiraceae bacterium]|nr:DNA alkylation repair protein [Lachnospiraceae bacterium]
MGKTAKGSSKKDAPLSKVQEMLFAERDEKYREFQAKLVPNIPAETILGVRTPRMRAVAATILKSDEKDAFLQELPHRYYEENLVHFFVIAGFKDFDACVSAVDAFLPYVDCWPVSDQSSPRVFKKNHDRLIPHI